MRIRVAGAQIPVTASIPENRDAILHAIKAAAIDKADILLTPEGSLSGYTHEFDQGEVARALQEICGAAREHGLGLALGTCFIESDGKCYDQLRFYDAEGSYLGFHSKTLTCGTLNSPFRGEIEHFSVSPLRTFVIKGIPCGGLICNDLWANPGYTPTPDTHLTQRLADAGARIIFHSVNGDRDGSPWSTVSTWNYHESNLELRARAGRLFVVTVDNCAPLDVPCSSPGGVVGPEGSWLVRAPRQGEQVFVSELIRDVLDDVVPSQDPIVVHQGVTNHLHFIERVAVIARHHSESMDVAAVKRQGHVSLAIDLASFLYTADCSLIASLPWSYSSLV